MSEPATGPSAAATGDDLAGLRVLDFSTQIAGPYCSKLLLDAGADVIKVEPPEGDSLRTWSATGADLGGRDSALFTFLNAGKQSVVGTSTEPHVEALVGQADVVIEGHGLESDNGERLDVASLRAGHPGLVVVSITPYGLTGPWHERRATEFTLQAECGSIGIRGVPGREPYQAGGRISEWAAGAYGALAALAGRSGARRGGRGEHVDLSILEVANIIFTNFSEAMNRLLNGGPGRPEHALLAPSVETPSIEPSADGYVGFCTNARQQFNDFLVLIDRPDLLADEELGTVAGRAMRFAEWTAIVHAWCSTRTTEEICEQAGLLRIPVSQVCNGETVTAHDQLRARGVYRPDAGDHFLRPRRPYLIDAAEPPAPRPAPPLVPSPEPGRQPVAFANRAGDPATGQTDPDAPALPLSGLRILDLTAWWAGPAATHLLATFGAEVVHVESTRRPDGMRMIGGPMAPHFPRWWEASPHFLYANSNKLGITLDLTTTEGMEILERLVGWCDAVVENFTPRVFDNFGLSREWVEKVNPRAVLLRMPAFGLTGPWRDRPGFAQTIEQLSGLAWITGHTDDQPRVPRGPGDPIAGVHGAIALLVTLVRSRRSGAATRSKSRWPRSPSTSPPSRWPSSPPTATGWTARATDRRWPPPRASTHVPTRAPPPPDGWPCRSPPMTSGGHSAVHWASPGGPPTPPSTPGPGGWPPTTSSTATSPSGLAPAGGPSSQVSSGPSASAPPRWRTRPASSRRTRNSGTGPTSSDRIIPWWGRCPSHRSRSASPGSTTGSAVRPRPSARTTRPSSATGSASHRRSSANSRPTG